MEKVQWRGLGQSRLETLGERLGKLVTPGTVLLLDGPMGAGKTTFTRALGRGMGLDRPERVCSPTFNICLTHAGPTPLMHIDLFRLAPDGGDGPLPASFEALGLDGLLEQVDDAYLDTDAGAAVLAIEWSSLWQQAPVEALALELARPAADVRDLRVVATGPHHVAVLRQWAGSDVAFRPRS